MRKSRAIGWIQTLELSFSRLALTTELQFGDIKSLAIVRRMSYCIFGATKYEEIFCCGMFQILATVRFKSKLEA